MLRPSTTKRRLMTTAFELVVLKSDGDPLTHDQDVVAGILDTGYTPEEPVKRVPSGYQDSDELQEDPEVESTEFSCETGGRIRPRYTSSDGEDGYFGVYIPINMRKSYLDSRISKAKELMRNITERTNSDYICLAEGRNIKLPNKGDSKKRPSLTRMTYFSKELLERFQLRPETTDADTVEVFADGVLIVPAEDFDVDKYKEVASQMGLDNTYL